MFYTLGTWSLATTGEISVVNTGTLDVSELYYQQFTASSLYLYDIYMLIWLLIAPWGLAALSDPWV